MRLPLRRWLDWPGKYFGVFYRIVSKLYLLQVSIWNNKENGILVGGAKSHLKIRFGWKGRKITKNQKNDHDFSRQASYGPAAAPSSQLLLACTSSSPRWTSPGRRTPALYMQREDMEVAPPAARRAHGSGRRERNAGRAPRLRKSVSLFLFWGVLWCDVCNEVLQGRMTFCTSMVFEAWECWVVATSTRKAAAAVLQLVLLRGSVRLGSLEAFTAATLSSV